MKGGKKGGKKWKKGKGEEKKVGKKGKGEEKREEKHFSPAIIDISGFDIPCYTMLSSKETPAFYYKEIACKEVTPIQQ